MLWRNEHGYYPILYSYHLGNLAVEVYQWITDAFAVERLSRKVGWLAPIALLR
jgi:hypothetical protein